MASTSTTPKPNSGTTENRSGNHVSMTRQAAQLTPTPNTSTNCPREMRQNGDACPLAKPMSADMLAKSR